MQRFRSGLISKARRSWYHSTLGLRVKEKKESHGKPSREFHATVEERGLRGTDEKEYSEGGQNWPEPSEVSTYSSWLGLCLKKGGGTRSQDKSNYVTEMCSGSNAGS